MDTSDPEISFDETGLCNHCQYFDNNVTPAWPFYNDQINNFDSVLSAVKSRNKNNSPYDCIVGISGGVDSSYLVYKLKDKDINPLILHVDAGWNSELAIENINKIVDYSGFDLETYVVNWDAMREVQLAFLKSGVANQDVPQDHVFIAATYLVANKYNIKTILSGSNYATESILPQSWGYDATDRDHLKSICIKYGGGRAYRKIPTMRFFDQVLINPIIKNIQIVSPLNSMYYSKTVAIKELESIGWRYYGGKHYESRWTHFFQSYYLPEKHGFDKRKAHLSSLVVTGEMNRQTAVEEMQKPLYNENEIQKDLLYISQKLRINLEELKSIISNSPVTHYTEHGNWKKQRDDFYAKYYSKALGFRNYIKNL